MRNALVDKGLYKIILNHENNFDIKTQTATFFVNKKVKTNTIEAYSEDSYGKLSFIKNIDGNNRFSLAKDDKTHNEFQKAVKEYN